MAHTIQLRLHAPGDLGKFRLPAGVQRRLNELPTALRSHYGGTWRVFATVNSWPQPTRRASTVLLTADQNLRYQQNLGSRRLAIIELPTNRLALIEPLAPAIQQALTRATPGSYQTVSLP